MSVRDLKFRTPDMRFGLSVDETIMTKMLALCGKAGNAETGGILVGYYTKKRDWAIVTDFSGPPSDSKRSCASFNRGVQGLKKWLNHIWRGKRHYYLGEWHYHPFASPEASYVDAKQLREHSENGPLVCPEPIMMIVGGNPNGAWEVKAYVYPKGTELLHMDSVKEYIQAHKAGS